MSPPARPAQSGQFRSLEGSLTTAEVPPKNDDDSREEVIKGCFANDSCESDNPPRSPSDGGYLSPGIGMVLFGVSVHPVISWPKGRWVYLYCILTCFRGHSRIQLVHSTVTINFMLVCNYILCMHL